VNATTLGVVRFPSGLGITLGSLPSITATTEFVVPRSIPMIFSPCAMVCSFRFIESVALMRHYPEKASVSFCFTKLIEIVARRHDPLALYSSKGRADGNGVARIICKPFQTKDLQSYHSCLVKRLFTADSCWTAILTQGSPLEKGLCHFGSHTSCRSDLQSHAVDTVADLGGTRGDSMIVPRVLSLEIPLPTPSMLRKS
jgi:hypothetical protein